MHKKILYFFFILILTLSLSGEGNASDITEKVLTQIISSDCANQTIKVKENFAILNNGSPLISIKLPEQKQLLGELIRLIDSKRPFDQYIASEHGSISTGINDGQNLLECEGKYLSINFYTILWNGEVLDPYVIYSVNQQLSNIYGDNYAENTFGNNSPITTNSTITDSFNQKIQEVKNDINITNSKVGVLSNSFDDANKIINGRIDETNWKFTLFDSLIGISLITVTISLAAGDKILKWLGQFTQKKKK